MEKPSRERVLSTFPHLLLAKVLWGKPYFLYFAKEGQRGAVTVWVQSLVGTLTLETAFLALGPCPSHVIWRRLWFNGSRLPSTELHTRPNPEPWSLRHSGHWHGCQERKVFPLWSHVSHRAYREPLSHMCGCSWLWAIQSQERKRGIKLF